MQKTENRISYTPKSQPSNLSTPYIDDLPNKFEYVEPIKPTKSPWYRNSKIHCIGIITLIIILIPLIALTVAQNSKSTHKQTLNKTNEIPNETPNEIQVDPYSKGASIYHVVRFSEILTPLPPSWSNMVIWPTPL